jgi:hypothetical protein
MVPPSTIFASPPKPTSGSRVRANGHMSTASVIVPGGSGPIVIAPSLSIDSADRSVVPLKIGLPLASNHCHTSWGATMGSPVDATSRTRKDEPRARRMTGRRSGLDGRTSTATRSGAKPGALT